MRTRRPYRAAPCSRCLLAPAKCFATEEEARAYAAAACLSFKIAYCVYRVNGTLKLVSRHAPPGRRGGGA
jgi:hypothetical protein